METRKSVVALGRCRGRGHDSLRAANHKVKVVSIHILESTLIYIGPMRDECKLLMTAVLIFSC